jgi:hypothetical protein
VPGLLARTVCLPDTRPFAVGIEVPIDDPIAEDGRLIR